MPRVRSLKKLSQASDEASQLQENLEQTLEPIIKSPIIDGVLIKCACLNASTVTAVEHKLGREPLGWIIVRKRGDARIWDLQDDNTSKKRTLALVASHRVCVDIWIF